MVIPQAVPGQLVPLVNTLANTFVSHLTWQNTPTAASILEAIFYASLRGGVMQTGRLVNWIRETSIGYISEIQTLFNLANIGFIALSAKDLLGKVQERYDFSIAKDGFKIWTLKSTAVSAAVAGTAFLGWKLANRLATPLVQPQQLNKQKIIRDSYGNPTQIKTHIVNCAEEFSTQQRRAKVLHITKLVLNVATACFVKNKFWFAFSLATSSYSLWKNLQLKWITFTRTFPWQSTNLPIFELKPTYHMLALPPSQIAATEECAICIDKHEVAETIAFCANHVFGKCCLAEHVFAKSKTFANADNILKTTTRHYQNNVYTGTSHKYFIEIDQENLPRCPNCNVIPLHNTLSIEVTDQYHGKFDATVTIKRPPVDRQYLFENLYAIYNTAQAGLAFLQTYPELAGTIYKIQRVMLVTDFIGNALTISYLFNKVNTKFNPNNSKVFKIAAIAAIGLMGVCSWYAMLQINFYLKSAIILNDVLNQLGLSADILKTLDVSFSAPTTHKIMQALLVNRIIASTALMFFSKKRKTSLLTVTTQLASLVGISTLKWIKVVQTLDKPLRTVIASGDKIASYLKDEVKSSQVTHQFLIPSSCLAHLQSTMKSITDFTVNFFNKSSWDSYVMINYKNGIETGRKRHYSITLQNNALEACGCTLTPYLTSTAIKVVDASYANAIVETQT